MASESARRSRVLWLSTIAFTLMFAVWLMFGVLGVPIQKELGLTDVQLGWLGAAAVLAGSLPRLAAGIAADVYGGRKVMTALMLVAAVPTYLVSHATTYTELLVCALVFGLAGNSFTVGIAWCAAWFPKQQQGLALGVFGAGNVGASVTKLIFGLFGAWLISRIPASGLLGGVVPGGWRFYPALYSVLLVAMAAAVWFGSPTPDHTPAKGRSYRSILAPLKYARVWEYSLQYVVVFGAYVALSLALPKYYVSVYGAELRTAFGLDDGPTATLRVASLLTTLFIFPASLLRPLGGWMSDKWGAAGVLWGVFAAMLVSGLLLSFPLGLGVWVFTALVVVLGCGMGVGKAAVYKLIPDHFPRDVGAVGGLVGMLGALGGFVLPPAWAYLNQWTGTPQTTFAVLTALTAASTGWFALSQFKGRQPQPVPEVAVQAAS
ncbi:nitrate nitrite transporter integral membrane protein : NarK1 protein OS=Thermus scotoductus (strain ATCC 700910 / SA-01) GN=TSC_c17470 PE=4 SV=1: MFS_1: MFS_1 [Gemmataceae bacterium]|nr:nitrate nitrite transporter integral membrane protein : NarK1 protein OS=Thermus scotoductus (strain ATCC 700910 / SA-01) GN=TSC_c17470 PE=4 SV=1: MFS_1: MFS_1 [Gemmataceae bacterium]VTU00287.1 nitrate nitrite transporter integral membrane protein : NarK1 protein OS=Thermus scotoductus (strain ATCC 700910 / SA-01) GN=TSC_c17470 PE=4 SV=1: MFS_1: MFS_1 [Gemmataceae bacterium]